MLQTLNSVIGESEIMVLDAGKIVIHQIGPWIDKHLERNPQCIQQFPANRTEFLPLPNGVRIPSVHKDGTVTWNQVTAVTRHEPLGDLVKIKTRSGRTVTATQQKSFLVWDGLSFQSANGSTLKVGDKVPLVFSHRVSASDLCTHLRVQDTLPPTQVVFGSQVHFAYDLWRNKKNSDAAWWREHHGTTFVTPFSRVDSLVHFFRTQMDHVLPTTVYPHHAVRVTSIIPEEIPLDREFGFLVGIYLAEGWCTQTFMGISNRCSMIRERIVAWCDAHRIGHHLVVTRSTQFRNRVSEDLKIHSVLLARLFLALFNTGSPNKKLPGCIIQAPLDCVCGVLDGYFSGDGTVSLKQCSVLASSASRTLLEGISILLSRIGVFAVIRGHQPKGNNVGSQNLHYANVLSVNNHFVSVLSRHVSFTEPNKQARLERWDKKQRGGYGRLYFPQGDVIPDPIETIEWVKSKEYVYDLTVEGPKTFVLFNGLGMDDTFHLSGVGNKNIR